MLLAYRTIIDSYRFHKKRCQFDLMRGSGIYYQNRLKNLFSFSIADFVYFLACIIESNGFVN